MGTASSRIKHHVHILTWMFKTQSEIIMRRISELTGVDNEASVCCVLIGVSSAWRHDSFHTFHIPETLNQTSTSAWHALSKVVVSLTQLVQRFLTLYLSMHLTVNEQNMCL